MASPLQPMNQKQLNNLIAQYLAASIKPARQTFANERNRAVEVSKAIAELSRGIGPQTNQAYQAAAQTQGALAQGFTGQMRTDAEADAAQAAQTLQRLGAPAAQIEQVQGVGRGASDAAYALGGAIPGGTLAREGAAFAAAQNQLPATALGRGRAEVYGIDQKEREFDAGIPKLRSDIQNQLIGQELQKAEFGLRTRAQSLYEAQFGEQVRSNVADEKAANARIKQSNRSYMLQVAKFQKEIDAAAAEGRRPHAALSKTYGYIVDSNGEPILGPRGQKIKVAKAGAKGQTPAAARKQRSDGVKYAIELRGDPLEMDKDVPQNVTKKGRYVAQPGKSEFKDGSTNKPRNAQRDSEYGFGEAQNILVETYGISRTKARAWLIAAGWKPPAKKDKRKPASQSRRPGPMP